MQDTELYEELLGIKAPWQVSRIALNVKAERVDIWAEHADGELWSCSACGERLGLYDHAAERRWRHLDTCQCQTYLHARVPRVPCPRHGVLPVRVPWAEPKSRCTMRFERLAIDGLRECDVTGATRLLGSAGTRPGG